MRRLVVAIPHSHTWFWTQTCIASLLANPPRADGFEVEVVVVDNSPWSPAIYGVNAFDRESLDSVNLLVLDNYKTNRFHASALDCIVEGTNFDYLMALETDVLALRPDWLQWFVDQMQLTDYAVGMWHHEQFINPSCTLYNGSALRRMLHWCKTKAPQDELRWGAGFATADPLDKSLRMAENPASILQDMKGWIGGPFAEKRGWPEGTYLKELPSGQLKGPGWYEPGQQLHHWAVEQGYTYTICPSLTTHAPNGLPLQTIYGALIPDPCHQLEPAELFGNGMTVHLWGGTRALDILKHEVTCQFVRANTPYWLAREARFWKAIVPAGVQERTLNKIRNYGWHITGQGSDHVSERDRRAAEFVRECYEAGGVTW